MEPFVVKHYSEDERPTIKGNGFDGLEVGEDREEAQRSIDSVNAAVSAEREACAQLCEAHAGHQGTGAFTILTAAADRILARSNEKQLSAARRC